MGRVVIPGFRKIETSGSGEGTGNYNDLTDKPSINNVPLVGNLNTSDLNLTDATLTEEGVPAEAKTVGIKMNEKPNYEEGTFSPSFTNTSLNPQVKAEYKKVGNIVSIAIKFSFADKIDTAQTGEILGLPFVVSTENATGGFYPMFAKTNNGNYSGMAPFENYMGEAPAVGITDLLGQQTTKVIILYGQYESTN